MNKTELDRLKELAEKATPGPWMAHVFLGPEVLTTGDIIGKYQVVIENEVIANCDNRNGDCAFITAANPATILAMIAEIEQLQNENQYLKDWAQIDIDASKSSQAFEEELCAMMGIEPDVPEKAARSEILKRIGTLQPRKCACDECGEVEAELRAKVERLEKEADWLAEHHYERDEISQRILGEEYVYTKEQWRESARKAVEGK